MIRVKLNAATRPVLTLWRDGELLAVVTTDTRRVADESVIELSIPEHARVGWKVYDKLEPAQQGQVIAHLRERSPGALARLLDAARHTRHARNDRHDRHGRDRHAVEGAA